MKCVKKKFKHNTYETLYNEVPLIDSGWACYKWFIRYAYNTISSLKTHICWFQYINVFWLDFLFYLIYLLHNKSEQEENKSRKNKAQQ